MPPPPPVTPSPHRFLLNKPRVLQAQQLQQTTFSNQPQSPFNPTPRFSIGGPGAGATQTSGASNRKINSINQRDDKDNLRAYELFDRSVKRRKLEYTVDDKEDDDIAVGENRDGELLPAESIHPDTQDDPEIAASRDKDNADFDDLLFLHEGRQQSHSQSSLIILSSPPTEPPIYRQSTAPGYNPLPKFIMPSTPSTGLRGHQFRDPSSTPAPAIHSPIQYHAPQSSSSTTTTTQHNTSKRPPRFLPTDAQGAGISSPGQQAHDPLPEAFSPHRRGQKFLIGGLASEVRTWIMGVENSSSSNVNPFASTRTRDSRAGRDEWLIKLVVNQISGGVGMTLVRGTVEGNPGSREVKMILAGEGTVKGMQKPKRVTEGGLVGIKRPAWDVTIEGEKWGVGVEWKVLC